MVCPARVASAGGADASAARVRLYHGAAFTAGDRVALVVDDTVRGITRARGGAEGLQYHHVLASLAPDDIEDVIVLKRREARTKAAPCEVEGGLLIRTIRYAP